MPAVRSGATPVFLAGIGDSEEDHWQRIWHRRMSGSEWVEHRDWDAPVCDEWVGELDLALGEIPGPKVLIAHSLGCLVASEWASKYEDNSVSGAFFVAVPDPDGPNFPESALGFVSPARRLPFRSTLVASEDDPYSSLRFSERTAGAWGSRFVDAGRRGHINLASGLGGWDEGRKLLQADFGDVIPPDEPHTA